MAPEPASEFSSDEMGDAEVVEAEVVESIDDYNNDEDEGIFESTPSKKMRGGLGREYKGGDFNKLFGKNLRDINSKSRRTKKSLVWHFYEP